MEAQLEQIRVQQKETWNKFSPGWKKWDEFTMNFLKPMGDEIVKLINPKEGEDILDIAAGTGEPGLTIAAMNKTGRVVITDLAEKMLDIAQENADRRQLNNVETVVCDASDLPFDNGTFDAISCRMGFMFFPDMQLAASEMARVLKPGGRIATSVWNGPDKNQWITAMMSVINAHVQMPAPPPGAPGMFRCAKPGFIADMFKAAGLTNVQEKEVNGRLLFDSPEMFWNFHTEVAAPVVAALGKADAETKEKIKSEVFNNFKTQFPNGHGELQFGAIVIYGDK